jgi:Uma2 family endonuclease
MEPGAVLAELESGTMASVVEQPDALQSPPPYPILRFSVSQYGEMMRLGLLDEDSHVELLEGWIVPKMPKYPPHDSRIDLLNHWLVRRLADGWIVRIQNSIVTADSVPEPDVAVVRGQPGDYEDRHPSGSDAVLVIEVADTTVRRDRAKAAIYARAGIPEYWIVNLEDGQIETFSQPRGRGAKRSYQTTKVLRGDASLKFVLDGESVGAISAREILG